MRTPAGPSPVEERLAPVVDPLARTVPLSAQAHAALSDALITGRYRVGTKLTVRGVAEALAISTTPARDAINRLIADGALEAVGPKTVVVPPLTLPVLKEIAAIRIALEGLAAELATPNAGPDDIAHLETLQGAINAALDAEDYRAVLSANRDFHFTIFALSNSPRLVAMIEPLWLRIGPSLNDLYPEFRINRRGVGNHLAATRGLRRRDPAAVRHAMEQDVRDGFARLSQHLPAPE